MRVPRIACLCSCCWQPAAPSRAVPTRRERHHAGGHSYPGEPDGGAAHPCADHCAPTSHRAGKRRRWRRLSGRNDRAVVTDVPAATSAPIAIGVVDPITWTCPLV
jgi:hypothetical protein